MGYLQENNPWCKELFFYHVPFDGSSFTGDDEEESVKATLCTHRLCTAGMQTLMGIGYRRLKRIRQASTTSTIMPLSGNHGKPSHATMKADDPRAAPLQHHMEYLLELGEVRATRVVATLVDGIQGHANQEDTVDNVYLPMSMGYRNCYNQYMNSVGFKTRCKANGAMAVDGAILHHVSFVMYALGAGITTLPGGTPGKFLFKFWSGLFLSNADCFLIRNTQGPLSPAAEPIRTIVIDSLLSLVAFSCFFTATEPTILRSPLVMDAITHVSSKFS